MSQLGMSNKERIQDLTATVCLTGVLLCVLAVILVEKVF